MARKNKKDAPAIADMQPDELNALKALVREFMSKIEAVDNEVETLKEDRKEIIEEYSDRLDVQTLKMALAVLKIEANVARRDAYDTFLEALRDPAQS